MKLNINDLFPTPETRPSPTKRTYDVRITLNKSGDKRHVIRFGFINDAAKLLQKWEYIEPSTVLLENAPNRIYFRQHPIKTHRNVYKLSISNNKSSKKEGCYFSFTPDEKSEKKYRMSWINNTFKILYDEENDLYYIEKKEEE